MGTINTNYGIESALSASLRGAQGAAERFARAAGRIATAGTDTPRAPDPISDPPVRADMLPPQEQSDLPSELIQARLAQRAYEANLAVMKRADEMEKSALDVLR